jgi:hypothetical protein
MSSANADIVFASRVFRWAGIYGLVALLPLYFTEDLLGRMLPPPVNHPEYYYSAVGLASVFQLMFLVMATDPVRYRPLMPVAVCEKLSYGVPAFVLVAMGRSPALILSTAVIDLLLGVLFFISYRRTAEAAKGFTSPTAV